MTSTTHSTVAGDVGWYWHSVERELRQRGYDTLAPDLPCDDDSAGLAEYADSMVEAIGARQIQTLGFDITITRGA